MPEQSQEGKIIINADPDIADLIPGFLENRRKDTSKIDQALSAGDFETIRVLGHSMKGAGSGYGFDGITEIGREIEFSAKEKNAAKISEHNASLQKYLNSLQVIYPDDVKQ